MRPDQIRLVLALLLALTAGLVLGASGWAAWQAVSANEAVEKQNAEFVRLTTELHTKEAALVATQVELEQEALDLRARVTDALGKTDKILAGQGSAVERLKAVIATLKQLRAELKTP